MKWLYKLEYKYGKHYIPHLMTIVVAGMAIVYLAQMMMSNVDLYLTPYGLLTLNRGLILSGQVWRLVTFIFVPTGSSPILLLISLYFYYMMGNLLEQMWGGFRLTLYYIVGIVGAVASTMITGYADNYYLNMSLFLAFATLAPDTQFRLFFILPIKAKWMAAFYALMIAFQLINNFTYSMYAGVVGLAALGFSLLNYALFFGKDLIGGIQNEIRVRRNRRNWNNRNR